MPIQPLWVSKSLESNFNLQGPFPGLIGRILSSRGYNDPSAVDQLLNPKLNQLRDPFVIDGMEQATERIVQAFQQNEKICIYADFDLDGTSGLALMLRGLQGMGFQNLVHYQPKRLSEGYGFHDYAVQELFDSGVSLIITVDVGITAHKAVQKANELGVTVILTDHHLPGEVLPEAQVILNPNKGTCSSGLGYLCGAGVAFYLLRALKRKMSEEYGPDQNNFDLKNVLDYFTIATLTDMVPLVEDNRVLVKHGLVKLAETQRAGLRALLEALDFSGRPLTSQDVAIRFAPKLNALSRLEAGILPIDIFLEESVTKARELVQFVLNQNTQRVKLQGSAEVQALEMLSDWKLKEFVFVCHEDFHRGIVGLIATKLSQNFNCPAFVGSIGKDGVVVGSARLPQGLEECLVEALTSAEDVLTRFGGHSAAAGFEFHQENQHQIIERLSQFFQSRKENKKPLEILYDVEASLSEVNNATMKWHDFVGPFGVGFPVPVVLFKGLQILQVKELKGGHIRLKVASDQNDSSSFDALLFSPSERQSMILNQHQWRYDILGELQWNYFAGSQSIQILVKDLKENREVYA